MKLIASKLYLFNIIMPSPNRIISIIKNIIINLAKNDERMQHSNNWDEQVLKYNTAYLKEIISVIGWPTKLKVGDEASQKAWLIAQHSDHDIEFQKECLRYLRSASSSEIEKWQIAFLKDRILVAEGKPQCYGTQFYRDKNGKFIPRPISNIRGLDARRKKFDLEKFDSEKYSEYFTRRYNINR